jgi:hypothetical protein
MAVLSEKTHFMGKRLEAIKGTRGGQNPSDPINPIRPEPIRPENHGFSVIFIGYGLK